MNVSQKYIVGLLIFLALFAVASGSLAYLSVHNQTHNCEQLEKLKEGTRIQIENNSKRLANIQYYKDNPDELAEAIAANNELLDANEAGDCRGLFG